MKKSDTFKKKLTCGQTIEQAVCKHLTNLLPDYKVKNCDQSKNSKDRDDYNLVDVIVCDKDGKPVLGVECKRSQTPYRLCFQKNGWKPWDNTPLNLSSIKHYADAEFPFYIININEFAKTILVAPIQKVLQSPHDEGYRKESGELVINFNSFSWMHYHSMPLSHILKVITDDLH